MNSHSQVVVYWSLTSNLNTPSTRQALVFSFTSCVKKDNVEQVGWEQHIPQDFLPEEFLVAFLPLIYYFLLFCQAILDGTMVYKFHN